MWYSSGLFISLAGATAPVSALDSRGKKKKMKKFLESRVYQNWFMKLMEDALNRYHFKNLPDTCSERVILQSLLWYGAVIFARGNFVNRKFVPSKDGAIISLPGAPTEQFNIYGEPAYGWIWARNGLNQKIKLILPNGPAEITNVGFGGVKLDDTGDGVFVRETKTMYPFIFYTMDYAYKIWKSMITLDSQQYHMRRPYLIQAREEVVEAVEKVMGAAEENDDYVILDEGVFNVGEGISVMPKTIEATDLKTVQELVEWYLNQYRELCGISNNPAVNKKERVLTDEVNVNNEQTEFSVNSAVDYINEQLKVVNTAFGTNIICEVNESAENEEYESEDTEDGETDESDSE